MAEKSVKKNGICIATPFEGGRYEFIFENEIMELWTRFDGKKGRKIMKLSNVEYPKNITEKDLSIYVGYYLCGLYSGLNFIKSVLEAEEIQDKELISRCLDDEYPPMGSNFNFYKLDEC